MPDGQGSQVDEVRVAGSGDPQSHARQTGGQHPVLKVVEIVLLACDY
jgi:hypothetical protein